MDLDLSVFREPRGVMRLFHFVFSICAFATITGYSGFIDYEYKISNSTKFNIKPINNNSLSNSSIQYRCLIEYPFVVDCLSSNPQGGVPVNCMTPQGDYGSDSRFFVTTGVLAMLYSLAISAVYLKFDKLYKNNTKLPLLDFILTVFFGVLWLSSSAAWANSLTGIKHLTDEALKCTDGTVSVSSFSSLNISVVFGFLNFFLWASDLWFLYKETFWFQGNQQQSNEGV